MSVVHGIYGTTFPANCQYNHNGNGQTIYLLRIYGSLLLLDVIIVVACRPFIDNYSVYGFNDVETRQFTAVVPTHPHANVFWSMRTFARVIMKYFIIICLSLSKVAIGVSMKSIYAFNLGK